jgi:hypothetical protein
MKNINTRKLFYHLRYRYLTLSNVALAIALVVGANWAWGSIGMMQRNYTLQKSIELKQRQEELTKLQVATLGYEQNYYQSNEYKELAAREYLGLALPGEKVLILPPNSPAAKMPEPAATVPAPASQPPGNLQQWMNFLFGGNRRSLQK